MTSSTNTFDETSSADYLDNIRKELAQNRAANLSARILTLNYIIGILDELQLVDLATIDGNTNSFIDTINLSDTAIATDLGRDFRCTNDAGGGLTGGQPIKASFWVTS